MGCRERREDRLVIKKDRWELEKKERELALREKTLAVVCNDNLQISDHLAKHGTSK
jgi:hypothetical protein